ncbi:hypothetical protein ACFQYP_40720 [Nonomuraea antimicrobica]|uniref:hypothetical protein n=1 Tax=Nonomuraea antimicrobica TaxID=561173 RepID=UPI0031E544B5
MTSCRTLGDDRAELVFDRLLTSFFTERDAALPAGLGMNCVRIPVDYLRTPRTPARPAGRQPAGVTCRRDACVGMLRLS